MRLRERWLACRSRLLQLWAAGAAASVVVTIASALGYLESLQTAALDLLLWVQGQRLASEVVIVAIDDDAFESLGRRQPLPRPYLAQLLRALQRSGAAVVGLDIDLSSPTTPGDDGALAQAIRESSQSGVSRVVIGDLAPGGVGPRDGAAPFPGVLRGSHSIPVDRDGVIRRAALIVPRPGGSPRPAFSLAVLAGRAGMDQDTLEQILGTPGSRVSLPVWRGSGRWDLQGAPSLAIRSGELWRINFAGPAGSFLTIPSTAVIPLADPGVEIAADNPLRDRVVLVGGTFRESRDVFQTPHGPLAGVEIHANLVHMLATRSFVQPSGWATSFGVQLGVVAVAGVALAWLGPLPGTLVGVGGALLCGVPASYVAFQRGGYWVDFLLPVLAICLLGLVAEALARRRVRESLGRYVGREVMSHVLAENPSLRGERREVSILMSDLRGFTPFCEAMAPEAVAAHLNQYFSAMTAAIFAHRGMINDFVGDAIMAVFGAPLPDPEHVLHAVQSAVAMNEALQALNRRWEAEGLPALRMGIGVHTGEVFAGNVGGPDRLKYAVVGDPVNATARLESLNKDLGTTILITEETRTILGDQVRTTDRGEMAVKGRARPLRVHELLTALADGAQSTGGH